jgi:hypothetical protein
MAFMYLWPAATNVVARRAHKTNIARFHPARAKRGSTAIPSWITPAVPATFSLFNQTTTAAKKLPRKLIQLETSFESYFGLIRKC